jgi:hypothetical protein
MGTLHPRPLLCERTRGWASLALDGELSEFEGALMRAHLERCAACAAFALDVTAATDAVRTTPLRPVPHQFALPARPRRVASGVVRLGAVAAVFVGALGLAGSLAIDPGPPPGQGTRALGASDQVNDLLIRGPQRLVLTPPPLPDRGRKVLSLPL